MTAPTHAAPGRTRRWPVRLILVGIVFALVLPGLVFCGLLLNRIATTERIRSIETAEAAAGRVAEALDREIANAVAALLALSTSQALRSGDLAAFGEQARTVSGALRQTVVLALPDGQQLVNTRMGPAQTLPQMGSRDTLSRVLQTRQPAVSDLYTGGAAGTLAVVVQFPVVLDGRVAYVLAISMHPDALADLMRRQALPHGWLATLMDGAYRVVARNQDQQAVLGREVPEDILPRNASQRASWLGTSMDGREMLLATHRLRLANWMVGIGVPLRVVEAPLRSTLWLLAITGGAALAMAVALAWTLATTVSRPLVRLAAAAAAREAGVHMPDIRSHIAEVDDVAQGLVRATNELERRVRTRTAELETANQRLRDEAEARAQAEEQLRQAQKMEAVGQLTGGIAHDFNNLLTIVIGSLDLVRRRTEEARQKRLLDNALEGATRAATLTARLLAFSRRQPLMPGPVDPNRLISGMSELLRRTLSDTMVVETVLAGGVWPAYVDPNQLENALLNLAVNARDAILAGTQQGRIEISTANAVLNAADLAGEPDVAEGEYVAITITDNGVGMNAETAGRVFEPFFTTKPVGQGTGLGLSQVHGFVKQSGGRVTMRTAPGEGTSITLYLPRHDAGGPEEVQVTAAPAPAQETLTVLLVEDDAGVRRTSAETLRELGHAVLEAPDGPAALRLLQEQPRVSVLVTDVMLPGMHGAAVAAAARTLRPGLPVLFVSGFTGEEPGGAIPDGGLLLQKPFTVEALAAKLREAVTAEPR